MKNIIFGILIFSFNLAYANAGYFAEINTTNNVVKRVVVAESVAWCENNLGGKWIETFVNNLNKNYASKGYDYFEIYNDFVAPSPHPSWVLDEKRKWQPPIPMPKDGKKYEWNENLLNWNTP